MRFLLTPWAERSPLARGLLLCLATAGAAVVLLITMTQPDAGAGLLVANVFATPTWVMRSVAKRLVNNAAFAGTVNRSYDEKFRVQGAKVGAKVQARLPQRYQITVGATLNATPLQDNTVDIEITDQSNIGFEYGSWAATLFVEDYMERYGNPAVDQLVNNIDYTGLTRCYKKVAKYAGTPNVPPGSTGTLPQAAMQPYVDAVTKLRDAAAPAPYVGMLSANMHGYAMTGMAELFNPTGAIAANFRNGQFAGPALGVSKWHMDQNVTSHTIGALGGTPLVNGASQTGASIICDGAGASAISGYLLEGDIVNFAGVYEINPLSHAAKTRLKDFVVTADVASIVTTGAVTIPISPSIITSGEWATCSASPANNAAVTIFGHASSYAGVVTEQALIYNKDAFALVMADAELPKGLWVAERISNAKLGISIRFLKDYSIKDDLSAARLDTFHGWATIRQELAARVCG